MAKKKSDLFMAHGKVADRPVMSLPGILQERTRALRRENGDGNADGGKEARLLR